MDSPQKQGIQLIEEVLKDLENSKNSITASIKKLKRAATLLNEEDTIVWCEIQLGNRVYTQALYNYVEEYINNDTHRTKESNKKLEKAKEKVIGLGLLVNKHFTVEELSIKSSISGGGFADVGFIEEKYNDLVRTKKGNDGKFYKTNLQSTLAFIKTVTHQKATNLYKNYAFKGLTESSFGILKREVEDVLFELNPELAEKILLAFKAVSSDNPEEWSHALTTCRRFFEQLADTLFPPTEEKINGRSLNKVNYINRLWAYMDKSIESESNKNIAKAHVDLLGAYLQSLYKISNKGVHSGLTRLEALKSVMHIYLMCADLLGYLNKKTLTKGKLNIHTATLDELESLGNISRTIAKEIVRLRVVNNTITEDLLKSIPKLSKKGLTSLLNNFILES